MSSTEKGGAIILLHARARQPDLIVLSAAHGSGGNGLRLIGLLTLSFLLLLYEL
jgi:nucleotide-binding universal stress UspA family protein